MVVYSLNISKNGSIKCWLNHFNIVYNDRVRIDFLSQFNHYELAMKVVRETEKEIRLYEQYQDYYSYGFYVAQRNT